MTATTLGKRREETKWFPSLFNFGRKLIIFQKYLWAYLVWAWRVPNNTNCVLENTSRLLICHRLKLTFPTPFGLYYSPSEERIGTFCGTKNVYFCDMIPFERVTFFFRQRAKRVRKRDVCQLRSNFSEYCIFTTEYLGLKSMRPSFFIAFLTG